MQFRSFRRVAGLCTMLWVHGMASAGDMASPNFDRTFAGYVVDDTDAPAYVVAGNFTQHEKPQDDVVYVLGDTLYYMGSSTGHRDFWDPVVVSGSEGKIASVYAADVTGDGYDDLIAYGQLTLYVFISSGLPGVGVSPFAAPSMYPMTFKPRVTFGGDEASPTDIDFGDFDGDGDVDLVVGLQDNYYEEEDGDSSPTVTYTWNGNYVVSLNQGGGVFATNNVVTTIPDAFSIGDGARGDTDALEVRVAVGDFDKSGHLDVAFGFHTAAEWLQAPQTRWYAGNGDGTFNFDQAVTTGHISGVEDIVAFTPTSPNTRVLSAGKQTYLALAFETQANVLNFVGTRSDLGLNGTPRGPMGRAWELNGDGLTDLVFADGASSALLVGVDWSTGNTDQRANPSVYLGTDVQQADVGDFDADGRADVVGVGRDANGQGIIEVNYNDTETDILTFYKNNGCSGYIGKVSGAVSGTYDLTKSNPPFENDEARSMAIWSVAPNTQIEVYDDAGGAVSAGWSLVQTTSAFATAYCLNSFQLTQTEDGVSVTYTKHTDHSADKDENDVDGKVSRVVVTPE